MSFRCAAASRERAEPVTGTASTVRAFLLVENAGPWGVDALRDARMPHEVKESLRLRGPVAGVRVLLVRRHAGVPSGPGLRVFAAFADPEEPWLESGTVDTPAELLDLDLAALGRGRSVGLTPDPGPVLCVCTHGRHDTCCAELGRPTANALAAAHPGPTWEVSHIGGDRFAANLLVLPEGLYYGRVPPERAAGLVDGHLAGHLDLDLLRGRSGFGFAVQVAEVALRRHLGETRTSAVRLLGTTRSGDDTEARFSVAGTGAGRSEDTGDGTSRGTSRSTSYGCAGPSPATSTASPAGLRAPAPSPRTTSCRCCPPATERSAPKPGGNA